MIQFVFLDLDDTILDFKRTEHECITKTLLAFGIEPSEKTVARYSEINASLWKKLEKGEIKREHVLSERFRALLRELGRVESYQDMRIVYENSLAESYFTLDGAKELLSSLYGRYRLFVASNGIAKVQRKRILGSDIEKYFENIFISEELGSEKPSALFFDKAFKTIKGFRKEHAIILGDSLSSDIKGGIAAGIKTCLFNPQRKRNESDIRPTFEIRRLSEFETLLANI